MRAPGTPDQHYIPREDVDMTRLSRTAHVTHCPYKGDASYWTIRGKGREVENGVWSYEAPFEAMTPIGGYLAFYQDRVDPIEESGPPPLDPRRRHLAGPDPSHRLHPGVSGARGVGMARGRARLASRLGVYALGVLVAVLAWTGGLVGALWLYYALAVSPCADPPPGLESAPRRRLP